MSIKRWPRLETLRDKLAKRMENVKPPLQQKDQKADRPSSKTEQYTRAEDQKFLFQSSPAGHDDVHITQHEAVSFDASDSLMATTNSAWPHGEERCPSCDIEEADRTARSDAREEDTSYDQYAVAELQSDTSQAAEEGSGPTEYGDYHMISAMLPSLRITVSPESTRLCTLCADDGGMEAVGHCAQCDEDLCAACVHRHGRMSLAIHHTITLFSVQKHPEHNAAALAEFGRPLSMSRTRTMAAVDQCPKHREEKLRFFCKSCQKPVCRDCILTSHKQHVTEDIGDVTQAARTELTGLIRQLEQKKKEMESYLHTFEDYKTQFESQAQRVEDMMRTFYQDVKAAVDSSYQSLSEELQEIRHTELERIQNNELIVQNNIEDVNRLLSHQGPNTESSILVLSQHELIAHAVRTLDENIHQVQLGQGEFFVSRNPKLTATPHHLLGQVQFTIHASPLLPPRASNGQTVVREVLLRRELAFNIWEMNKTRSAVHSVVETSSGTMWVATARSLLKVQHAISKESGSMPDDMAKVVAGPGDKLLVSLGQGSHIKMYANGSWSTFMSVPKGSTVLASKPGQNGLRVYVAVTSQQLGTTKILSYSTGGQVCQQHRLPTEIFQEQTPPDTGHVSGGPRRPRSITSGSSSLRLSCMAVGMDGSLYLGDVYGARVLMVDNKGQLCGQYRGPDGQSGCQPQSLCEVGPGQVVVADSQKGTVELVSMQGKRLATLLSREHLQDIGMPSAVTVDSKGRLWVGTSMGHVSVNSFLHTFP